MEIEHSKNEFKNKVKRMSVTELQKTLEELHKEKMLLGHTMRTKEGSSMYVKNYPSNIRTGTFGNYKNIIKNIARVKTFLTIKMKAPIK